MYIFRHDEKHIGRYEGAFVARWDSHRSLSMGMYIFMGTDAGERILKHEYGHSIQSMILGPLYLIAVGIPSLLWCNFGPAASRWQSGKCSYYSVYPESWADRLGNVTESGTKHQEL